MKHVQAHTQLQPATLRVNAHAPTIVGDPRSVELRCNRRHDCDRPACGKLLMTIRSRTGNLPDGLTIVRECPRQNSIVCEFEIVNPPAGTEPT